VAGHRFGHQQANSRTVIDHGLEQQRQARNLAQRLATDRDNLDGLPSVFDLRRAATRREQIKALTPAFEHQASVPRSPGIEM
jgi:hypothetical protein